MTKELDVEKLAGVFHGLNLDEIPKEKIIKMVEIIYGINLVERKLIFKQGYLYRHTGKYPGAPYICAFVERGDGYNKYGLINIKSGDRWCEMMSLRELSEKCSDDFEEAPKQEEEK